MKLAPCNKHKEDQDLICFKIRHDNGDAATQQEIWAEIERLRDAMLTASSIVFDAIAEEREQCAKVCEERGRNTKNGEWHGNHHASAAFAECIRDRSNIK